MPAVATVSAKAIGKIIAAASAVGVKTEALLRAAQLDPSTLDNLDVRVTHSQLMTLYEQAARLTGDAAFGLHVGEQTDIRAFDVLSYVVMNSLTVGEALNNAARYHSLWNSGADYRLEHQGNATRILYCYKENKEEERRHDCEMTLALVVSFGRRVTGVDWSPLEVTFQHPAPPDTTEHMRIFRSPVLFSRPDNAVTIDSALLELPLRTVDLGLRSVLERYAEELLSRLPPERSLRDEVRQQLYAGLRSGDVSLESVAKRLGLSGRNLQRRLREEQTSFQELLDRLRHELARKYLQDPRVTITEAAFLLGFSDPSAFHRAFRRWTGLTPYSFRRMQR